MEYSVAKAIENLKPRCTYSSSVHLSNTPVNDIISPGIGHAVQTYKVFVAIPGHLNPTKIIKKVESENQTGGSQNEPETVDSNETEPQASSSNISEDKFKVLNPILQKSLKHPRMIEAGSISFEPEDVEPKRPRIKQEKKFKNGNIKHHFQFI